MVCRYNGSFDGVPLGTLSLISSILSNFFRHFLVLSYYNSIETIWLLACWRGE